MHDRRLAGCWLSDAKAVSNFPSVALMHRPVDVEIDFGQICYCALRAPNTRLPACIPMTGGAARMEMSEAHPQRPWPELTMVSRPQMHHANLFRTVCRPPEKAVHHAARGFFGVKVGGSV